MNIKINEITVKKKSNKVFQSFEHYFLHVTFTDEPSHSGEDGNVKTTVVVFALAFDDTVHPSP